MTNERGGLLPVPSPPHHPPRILQPRPRAPLAHALCACGLPPTKINPPHAGNRHSQEARLVPSSSLARAFRLLDPSAPMPKRRRDREVRGCARAREGGGRERSGGGEVCGCERTEMAPVCEGPSSSHAHAFLALNPLSQGRRWDGKRTGEHAPCLLTLVREGGGRKVREGDHQSRDGPCATSMIPAPTCAAAPLSEQERLLCIACRKPCAHSPKPDSRMWWGGEAKDGELECWCWWWRWEGERTRVARQVRKGTHPFSLPLRSC